MCVCVSVCVCVCVCVCVHTPMCMSVHVCMNIHVLASVGTCSVYMYVCLHLLSEEYNLYSLCVHTYIFQ